MNMTLVIFYIFGTVAVASSFMVVTAQNPVRAVLSLVLTFFAMSIIWLLAHAEFLALVLILVYVGAVMTLFLFVIMMLNLKMEKIKYYIVKQAPLLILTLFTFLSLLYLAIHPNLLHSDMMVKTALRSDNYSNTEALGVVLYTNYVLAFEVAGVLLMLSIIAAITLTHRPPRFSRKQNIREQIMVDRDDRVKLISMPSESEEGKAP